MTCFIDLNINRLLKDFSTLPSKQFSQLMLKPLFCQKYPSIWNVKLIGSQCHLYPRDKIYATSMKILPDQLLSMSVSSLRFSQIKIKEFQKCKRFQTLFLFSLSSVVIHSGRLQPYSQTLDKAEKTCLGQNTLACYERLYITIIKKF